VIIFFEDCLKELFKLKEEHPYLKLDLNNEKDSLNEILDSNEKIKKIKFEMILEDFKISGDQQKVKIEFYENKPFHSRNILIDNINNIFNQLECLKKLKIQFLDYSWFSILWTPTKSFKSKFIQTSFLVYYQFNLSNSINVKNYSEIPIIGILPYKLEDNLWLTKISKIAKKEETVDSQEFRFFLDNSIKNVYDYVIENNSNKSFDYEVFLNSSKYTY